jgi:hypothetical protein
MDFVCPGDPAVRFLKPRQTPTCFFLTPGVGRWGFFEYYQSRCGANPRGVLDADLSLQVWDDDGRHFGPCFADLYPFLFDFDLEWVAVLRFVVLECGLLLVVLF